MFLGIPVHIVMDEILELNNYQNCTRYLDSELTDVGGRAITLRIAERNQTALQMRYFSVEQTSFHGVLLMPAINIEMNRIRLC